MIRKGFLDYFGRKKQLKWCPNLEENLLKFLEEFYQRSTNQDMNYF